MSAVGGTKPSILRGRGTVTLRPPFHIDWITNMPEDPRSIEFGSAQYLNHWGLVDGTRYQESAQYNDGFGAYPAGSSNDCPHPEQTEDPDGCYQRRRWIRGYNDACILAGVVGNPSEETLDNIYSALPADLQAMVDGRPDPPDGEERRHMIPLDDFEPVCRFIHNAIGSLKEAMDSAAARKAGAPYSLSHQRAWGMLCNLEAETALWKDP